VLKIALSLMILVLVGIALQKRQVISRVLKNEDFNKWATEHPLAYTLLSFFLLVRVLTTAIDIFDSLGAKISESYPLVYSLSGTNAPWLAWRKLHAKA
jgi:hypothetical protein